MAGLRGCGEPGVGLPGAASLGGAGCWVGNPRCGRRAARSRGVLAGRDGAMSDCPALRCSALLLSVRLQHCIQVWALRYRKDRRGPEEPQR